jgi:hypothetical protein
MPLRHRRITQKVFVHDFAQGYLSRLFEAVIRVPCRTAATANDALMRGNQGRKPCPR